MDTSPAAPASARASNSSELSASSTSGTSVPAGVPATVSSSSSSSAIATTAVPQQQQPTPPERPNSQASVHKSQGGGAHIHAHRQSFAENLRNPPPSPRAQRHLSFTQSAIMDLLIHPPPSKVPNPQFSGRDWRDVALGELISEDDVKWVELDTSVEEATMALLKSGPVNAVLVREKSTDRTAISTFDYNDLNAYLLVVVGLANPEEDQVALYDDIANKARERVAIPLRDIQPIFRKEQLVSFAADERLSSAVEVLGGGIHRVLVTKPNNDEIIGVLTQLKVLEFFWTEAISFPVIDRLYNVPLRDLHLGTLQIIAINADRPLTDALTLMNNEGLTSVAVVDNGLNVVGNISTADVRHLTSAASMPLLQSTCMHFISVILSERGMEKGRDSFPVFYVNPYSTLAHTVAKLTATQSHRMWVVESPSPSPSVPGTPLLQPVAAAPAAAAESASIGATLTTTAAGTPATASSTAPGATVLTPIAVNAATTTSPLPSPALPAPNPQPVTSVPAAALPGAHLSGRLTGVVSLTDILNMFAKSSGLRPSDPGEQRARRRRSSSSSVRPSMESSRASIDFRR